MKNNTNLQRWWWWEAVAAKQRRAHGGGGIGDGDNKTKKSVHDGGSDEHTMVTEKYKQKPKAMNPVEEWAMTVEEE